MTHLPTLVGVERLQGNSQLPRPNTIVHARVVETYADGTAMLRVSGELLRVQSDVPLQLGSFLKLKIVECDKKLCKLQLLSSQSASKSAIFDSQTLDFSLLLALSQIDERYKKIVRKEIFARRIYEHLFEASHKLLELVRKEEFREAIGEVEKLFLDMDRIKEENLEEWILHFSKSEPKLQELVERSDGKLKKHIEELMQFWQLAAVAAQASGMGVGMLPLLWDGLEHSSIVLKKLPHKEAFLCKIYLNFRDLRRIGVTLILHKRHLTLHLLVEDEAFRRTLEDSLGEIRLALEEGGKFVSIFLSEFKEEMFADFLAQENVVDKRV